MKEILLSNTALKTQAEQWLQHEFYRTAVVLGIDIGLEGIGRVASARMRDRISTPGVIFAPDYGSKDTN